MMGALQFDSKASLTQYFFAKKFAHALSGFDTHSTQSRSLHPKPLHATTSQNADEGQPWDAKQQHL
jgi:hypothetical protein